MDWFSLVLSSLVPVVVGGIMVAVGVRSIRAQGSFQGKAARAPGQVIDVRWRMGAGGDASLIAFAVLRFQTPDGRTVEAESPGGTPAPDVGQQVTVLYDPGDPSQAELEGGETVSTVLYVLFIVLGAFVMVLGLGGFVLLAVFWPGLIGSP